MGIERARIEKSFAAIRERTEEGDWNGFVDLFAEDCTFLNSILEEPIVGREAVRAMATQWPRVVNHAEWVVIDGNRLVVGWNEKQEGMSADAPAYRGISTFVFDPEGRVSAYEGMFDTAAVAAAMRA